MENCGSAVISVISFFGSSLLPLEITDRGFKEDHRISEPSQASVAIIAQETSHRPVLVVMVHGEIALIAVTTAVTVQTTTNGTAAVLLFEKSFILWKA